MPSPRIPRHPARPLASVAALAIVGSSALGAAPAVAATDDTQPPIVIISTPLAGQLFTTGAGQVRFTASDPSGIEGWSFSVDGRSWASGVYGYYPDLPIGQLANGAHDFTLTVRDGAGNEYIETRPFTVDRTTVGVRITSPGNGAWVRPNTPLSLTMRADDYVFDEILVDGAVVRPRRAFTTNFTTTTLTTGSTWVDGSAHSYQVNVYDNLGRPGSASVSVNVDAAAPTVAITESALPAVIARSTVIHGTAVDTGSGIANLQLHAYPSATCAGASTQFAVNRSGGSWSSSLGSLPDGDYCLVASASDNVGHSATSSPVHVTVDTTPPLVPAGLAPQGSLVESITQLSWDAVPDAAAYEYRTASAPALLGSAPALRTTATTVAVGSLESGSLHWQVRSLDAVGNASDWTAVTSATVHAAPPLSCPTSCPFFGADFSIDWSPVPDATAYQLRFTGTDAAGDPVEHDVDTTATRVDTRLPDAFPTGPVEVRVRAAVPGAGYTRWSPSQSVLRFGAPAQPGLLAPGNGERLDSSGSGIGLGWSADPAALAWDVRVSTSPTAGPDGGLDDGIVGAALTDPLTFLLHDPSLLSELRATPGNLAELDAIATCAALRDLVIGGVTGVGDRDAFDRRCADGRYALPTALSPGTYYWQVRGIGLDAAGGATDAGPWSAIGRFVVPQKPAPGAPPAAGRGSVPVTVDGEPEVVLDDAAAGESESTSEPAAGSSAGGSDANAGDASTDAGLGVGWIIGGAAAVVLVGGGALTMLLLRRR